jgi:DNA-binding HxlR family transcriptional regulator
VRDLVGGPRRFVELQRVLPGISTEQLRSRLNRMVADGLLTRQRYREVPPRVDYELTERARDLLPVIGALARWGYQWSWSPPHTDEQIDIGAVFRSLCGLAAPTRLGGTAELVVRLRGGQDKPYVLTVTQGAIAFREGTADAADCRIAGPEKAWVDALGPDASRASLDLSGDQGLAASLLDLIAPVTVREAAVA